MSVKTEKIVIEKYIVTVSRSAEKQLRKLAIKLAIGFFFIILAVIGMVAFFGGEQDNLRIFGNSAVSSLGGVILILYFFFLQRTHRKAKEKIMKEAGWNGSHPAEMRVDKKGAFMRD